MTVLPDGTYLSVLIKPTIRGARRERLLAAARSGHDLNDHLGVPDAFDERGLPVAHLVRVVEYDVPDRAGNGTGELITLLSTIVEPGAARADEIAAAYHERWEQDVAFIERLVAALPAFEEAYECHVLNYDEVLPTVFMEEARQSTTASFLGASDEPDWRSTLAFLEDQYALGDKDVQDLIFLWFIHPLPLPDQPGHGLTAHLGPAMTDRYRALLKEQGLI